MPASGFTWIHQIANDPNWECLLFPYITERINTDSNMKKLLLLLPLLLTACSSLQLKREPQEREPITFHITQEVADSYSRIPVFLITGPNAVGYETIVETTLGDCNLVSGMKMACNFLTEYGDHRLIEGTLHKVTVLNTELPFIVVDTPLFKDVELPLPDHDVDFCLMYYVYDLKETK
jgi:hypothetical protein